MAFPLKPTGSSLTIDGTTYTNKCGAIALQEATGKPMSVIIDALVKTSPLHHNGLLDTEHLENALNCLMPTALLIIATPNGQAIPTKHRAIYIDSVNQGLSTGPIYTLVYTPGHFQTFMDKNQPISLMNDEDAINFARANGVDINFQSSASCIVCSFHLVDGICFQCLSDVAVPGESCIVCSSNLVDGICFQCLNDVVVPGKSCIVCSFQLVDGICFQCLRDVAVPGESCPVHHTTCFNCMNLDPYMRDIAGLYICSRCFIENVEKIP